MQGSGYEKGDGSTFYTILSSLFMEKVDALKKCHLAVLKVNDQLVTNATRFLAVGLKIHVWSHHRALKAKVQCDFSY